MRLLSRSVIGFTALFFVAFLLSQQGPKPIPPFEGDGNSQHDGQPKFCINVDTPIYVHNCDCMAMADDPKCEEKSRNTASENSNCKVYCRKEACRCRKNCRSTE